MYDIIVVGAGPAGLTASIFARRASKSVLVLEAKTYGGQIINTLNIENYPTEPHISGFEFATKIYEQAKELGAEIVFEKVVDINIEDDYKEVVTNKNKYKCKAIILATGSDNRKLSLDKEDELIGKGISYCATCDGAFFKKKNVAIAASSNTSLEDALYLSDIAKKVYVIYKKDNIEENLLEKLNSKDNISISYNSTVIKLYGDDKLTGIDIKDKSGNISNIEVDGLFVAIGRIPENQNFAKYVNLDDKGYIIANEDCKTNIEGVFVSGDNRTKELRQLVTATSDGAVAATNAIKYINKLNR